MTRTTPRRTGRRRGLTVYEVFLALALLLGSLAVLSQHVALGTRAGVRGRLQTQAALLAETKLAEVVGGVEPMTPASGASLADVGPGWTWSLEIATGPQPDLLDLAVTVAHAGAAGQTDASFTLRRLIRDPQAFVDAAAEASTPSTSTGTGSEGT